MHQQNKSSESIVKFRQARNYWKRVLEAAKPTSGNKTKEFFTSQKLDPWDIWLIANSVFHKSKCAIPPLFNCLEVLSYVSDIAKLFAKCFSESSNIEKSGISLPVFPARTNMKLHNISVTLKIVKKVIMNLESSKVSAPDCISVVSLKNCELY